MLVYASSRTLAVTAWRTVSPAVQSWEIREKRAVASLRCCSHATGEGETTGERLKLMIECGLVSRVRDREIEEETLCVRGAAA